MALMENASSSVTQAAPSTPGAPATPQHEQPATPVSSYVVGPGTPGSQSSVGTPNASHGKMASSMMVSPPSGKGNQLAMNTSHNVGGMNLANQYSSSTVQTQASNSFTQQQNQQHNQLSMMSPQQNVRPTPPYPSPPARALMAAKQAEQVARAQASTGGRPTLQSGFPRPVNQGTVQRQPGVSGGIPPQAQWANPGAGNGEINYMRQPGNPGLGAPNSGSSVVMQHASNPGTAQNDTKLVNMLTRNPEFAAHVITQNRKQHQRPQNMLQV